VLHGDRGAWSFFRQKKIASPLVRVAFLVYQPMPASSLALPSAAPVPAPEVAASFWLVNLQQMSSLLSLLT
jgi:hypothetical protein